MPRANTPQEREIEALLRDRIRLNYSSDRIPMTFQERAELSGGLRLVGYAEAARDIAAMLDGSPVLGCPPGIDRRKMGKFSE
jgi:hypothetical protein